MYSKNELGFRSYLKKYFPCEYEKYIIHGLLDIKYCILKKGYQVMLSNKLTKIR